MDKDYAVWYVIPYTSDLPDWADTCPGRNYAVLEALDESCGGETYYTVITEKWAVMGIQEWKQWIGCETWRHLKEHPGHEPSKPIDLRQ